MLTVINFCHSIGRRQITHPRAAKVKSYREGLSCEVSGKQRHSLSLRTNDAPHLKGVSLGIQDLTDNLRRVLHDVRASSQLLTPLERMVYFTARFMAIYG